MLPTDPIRLAVDLISIDSVNPSLVAGAAGESRIADFCGSWLAERGFEVTRLKQTPGRPSIVATGRGSGGGRSLLINGHLDTVSASPEQLVPTVTDGRLYGRGAFDTKSAVAAAMVAATRALESGMRGDVVLTLVADEEFGSLGTEEVLRHVSTDAAIVVEPSNLELTVSHRGFAWFEVHIEGLAAHGSMPEQGIDAIAHAARVMGRLDELRGRLEAAPGHPQLGHGTVRVATINGGLDAATVAPSCTLTVERRFLPGETPDGVEEELRRVIDAASGAATVTTTRLVARGAFESDPAWPIVRAVADATTRVVGRAATRGEPFWTDAGLIVEAGIPCIVIGVDGNGAHADSEWATTESIDQLTEILRSSIVEFCG